MNDKIKVTCILIVCLAGIGCSLARETTRTIDRLDNNARRNYGNSNVRDSPLEPRKHKPYHDLFFLERKSGFSTVYVNPLHGIAFMGGLQSLVTFVVIKIKVALVAVTIIGVIALALKIFGLFKYTSSFYKNDYPHVGPPPEFTGYSGPLPPHSSQIYDDTHGNDWSSYSEHYGRSSNPHHEFTKESKISKSANMTEIIYSFVNANKDECRNRLICELETMLMRSPFADYLTSHGITRHRPPESGSYSEDCTTYYTKCVDAIGQQNSV